MENLRKNLTGILSGNDKTTLTNPVYWGVFIIYVIVLTVTMSHHEPWGDEIHSWNIAKASGSLADLISNTRYEGHPPLWYIILWSISKFTHQVAYMQLVHAMIAALVVFLILFFSPFPLSTKLFMPFGYYFLFEYAVLSRNYAIGVLLIFCICLVIRKIFRFKLVIYYLLLLLLSNTHLLGLLMAVSLHFYYLLFKIEQQRSQSTIFRHILLGMLTLLPSFYFIYPPVDSDLNFTYWVSRWNSNLFPVASRGPLLAFLPIPAWWKYNFWNTQFLIELRNNHAALRYVNLLLSALTVVVGYGLLKANRKARLTFLANLLLSVVLSITFFSWSAAERYVGFLFIGFIAAFWLSCYETPVTSRNRWVINGFLVVQLIAGFFTVSKDILLPFSNLYKVNELINEVPVHEEAVADYWAMNSVSAFIDRPVYCIDFPKAKTFDAWNRGSALQNTPNRYFEGVKYFFGHKKMNRVYMISTTPPKILFYGDSLLFKSYNVKLFDKREGAIVKGSDLYLYEINSH